MSHCQIEDARSRVYGLLALGLEFPDSDFQALVASGEYADAFQRALAQWPDARAALDAAVPTLGANADAMPAAYSALFDYAQPAPLIPLNEAALRRDISSVKVFEDLDRFFEFIGLVPNEPRKEGPDWLPLQLEAMHYLCARTAVEDLDAATSRNLRALQRDFFVRHLDRWIPVVAARIAEHAKHPFYVGFGELLSAFAACERSHTESSASDSSSNSKTNSKTRGAPH